MSGARLAQSATTLPGTNPPNAHIKTKGRVMYGMNWAGREPVVIAGQPEGSQSRERDDDVQPRDHGSG